MNEIIECPLFEAFSTMLVSSLQYLGDPSKSAVEWESEYDTFYLNDDDSLSMELENYELNIASSIDDDNAEAFDTSPFIRSLQSHGNRTTIRDIAMGAAENTSGGANDDWQKGQTDGEIIKQSVTIYGTFFVFCVLLYCVLRKFYPKAYNLRSGWIRDHDKVQPNPRAKNPDSTGGFVSWIWKVWFVSDSELSAECGMDALCLCRVLEWGARLSLMGSLIGCFLLMPVYAIADTTSSGVEQLNTSNVPEGTEGIGYFMATVVAAYLIFGYTMVSYLDEFRWFYQFRYEFLTRPIPRNYTVYVRNLPEEYRTSRALVEYFSHLEDFSFGAGSRVDEEVTPLTRRQRRNPTRAWVALKIPKLTKLVGKRAALLTKLEHTINIEEVQNKIPKTIDETTGHEVPLVDSLFGELAELNRDVTTAIERIDRRCQLENPVEDYSPDDYQNPVLLEGSDAGDDTDEQYNGSNINLLQTPQRNLWKKRQTADAFFDSKSIDPSLDSTNGKESAAAYLTIPHAVGQDPNFADVDDLTMTSSEVYTISNRLHKSHSKNKGSGKSEPIEVEAGEPTGAENNVGDRVKGPAKKRIGNMVGEIANKTTTQVRHKAQVVGTIANGGMQLVGQTAKKAASLVLNKADDGAPLTAGFVSFSSLKACQVARQIFHSSDLEVFGMEVLEAPGAGDVNWNNVGKTHQELQLGLLLSTGLTTTLCLFWTVVITFISTLSSVEGLTGLIPQLRKVLDENEWLESLLAQVSPLMIVVANSLLRVILEALSGLEGHVSSALVEASLFSKLSAFMIIQNFFVTAISGSLISELSAIVDNPKQIFSLLGNSLPNRSSFFIQIMLIQTGTSLSLELLRVTPVAIAIARSLVGPRLTEEERRTTWLGLRPLADPLQFYHADILSGIVFFFVVFFVYATLAPITSIFVFSCFLFMGAIYRNQFIFVYPTLPDSGGKLWIQFMQIVPVSLIIAEVTIVGFLSLKKAPVALSLMFPLLFATVLFNIYIRQKHFDVANFLPGAICVEADRRNNMDGPMDMRFLTNQYQQPELRDKEVYPSNASLERQLKHGLLSRETRPEREL